MSFKPTVVARPQENVLDSFTRAFSQTQALRQKAAADRRAEALGEERIAASKQSREESAFKLDMEIAKAGGRELKEGESADSLNAMEALRGQEQTPEGRDQGLANALGHMNIDPNVGQPMFAPGVGSMQKVGEGQDGIPVFQVGDMGMVRRGDDGNLSAVGGADFDPTPAEDFNEVSRGDRRYAMSDFQSSTIDAANERAATDALPITREEQRLVDAARTSSPDEYPQDMDDETVMGMLELKELISVQEGRKGRGSNYAQDREDVAMRQAQQDIYDREYPEGMGHLSPDQQEAALLDIERRAAQSVTGEGVAPTSSDRDTALSGEIPDGTIAGWMADLTDNTNSISRIQQEIAELAGSNQSTMNVLRRKLEADIARSWDELGWDNPRRRPGAAGIPIPGTQRTIGFGAGPAKFQSAHTPKAFVDVIMGTG